MRRTRVPHAAVALGGGCIECLCAVRPPCTSTLKSRFWRSSFTARLVPAGGRAGRQGSAVMVQGWHWRQRASGGTHPPLPALTSVPLPHHSDAPDGGALGRKVWESRGPRGGGSPHPLRRRVGADICPAGAAPQNTARQLHLQPHQHQAPHDVGPERRPAAQGEPVGRAPRRRLELRLPAPHARHLRCPGAAAVKQVPAAPSTRPKSPPERCERELKVGGTRQAGRKLAALAARSTAWECGGRRLRVGGVRGAQCQVREQSGRGPAAGACSRSASRATRPFVKLLFTHTT